MDGCFRKSAINFELKLLGQKLHIVSHQMYMEHINFVCVCVCMHFIHTHASFRMVQVDTLKSCVSAVYISVKCNQLS